MTLKIVIGAGGSGGHLFPAQQLAQKLEGERILFAGHGLSQSPFFSKERVPFVETAAAPLHRPIAFLRATWKGFWQSIRLLKQFQPDVVVGFGSYHSLPLLLAAAWLRKKIVLFEANCTPGKVNRLLKPFAHKFTVQFPQKGGVLVPLLPWTSSVTKPSQPEARAHYGLQRDLCTVLIFGGSQGASFLNGLMPQVLALLGAGYQVLHFTGKGTVAYALQTPAVIKAFETQMPLAYAAADLVVCRSGAGTVAELIHWEKPALLIPYPHAGGHQIANGLFLEKLGARVVLQKQATPGRVAQAIRSLSSEQESVQERMRAFRSQHQGLDIAQLVHEVGAL